MDVDDHARLVCVYNDYMQMRIIKHPIRHARAKA
jgi:hypothetical protein